MVEPLVVVIQQGTQLDVDVVCIRLVYHNPINKVIEAVDLVAGNDVMRFRLVPYRDSYLERAIFCFRMS